MNKFIHIGPVAAERITGKYSGSNQWPSWIISKSFQETFQGRPFLANVKGTTQYGLEIATTQSGLLIILPDDAFDKTVERFGGEKKAYSVNLAPYWLPDAGWLYWFHKTCKLCPLGTVLSFDLLMQSMGRVK